MQKIEENKEKVKKVLSDTWQSTRSLERKTGLHWYKVDAILEILYVNNEVEKDVRSNATYWKLKR